MLFASPSPPTSRVRAVLQETMAGSPTTKGMLMLLHIAGKALMQVGRLDDAVETEVVVTACTVLAVVLLAGTLHAT